MNEKLLKVLRLISENHGEISDLSFSDDEIYFRFRGKIFSLASKNGFYTFYAYPKWAGSPLDLVRYFGTEEEREDAVHASAGPSDMPPKDRAIAKDIFETLEARQLGLDKLFSDLGIE